MTNIECQPVKQIYCKLIMLAMTNIECQPVKSKTRKQLYYLIKTRENDVAEINTWLIIYINLLWEVVDMDSQYWNTMIVINRLTTCVPINYKHELVQYRLTFLH